MILASASPRRRELLGACGIEVTVLPQDVDERRLPGECPTDLVARLSNAKAQSALASIAALGNEVVVAADTIVWDDGGDVLGKPRDAQDAAEMLRTLSGRTHHVSTGVTVVLEGTEGPMAETFVETTDVTFSRLTDEEMAAYVASGEPSDKAGAYGIQGLGRLLVEGIRGDYPNVVGLPVNRLLRTIDRMRGRTEDGLVTSALGGSHEQV